MDKKLELELAEAYPGGATMAEVLALYTNTIAAACAVPAKYLYGSMDDYLRGCAPVLYRKVIVCNRDYSTIESSDVPSGVARTAEARSIAEAERMMIYLSLGSEQAPRMSYRGPGAQCMYVVVRNEELADVEVKAKQRDEIEKYVKNMFLEDGLTSAQCLEYYIANQRESGAPRKLTKNQIAAAQLQWSRMLYEKARDAPSSEPYRVTCQSQYDLDD